MNFSIFITTVHIHFFHMILTKPADSMVGTEETESLKTSLGCLHREANILQIIT